MIQLKIHFDSEVNKGLYQDFCEYLFDQINGTLSDLINDKKLNVRERLIVESSVINWTTKVEKINLRYYVENCLEMVNVKGDYIIRVRRDLRVRNSRSSVYTLIKLLEYGNETVPAYPIVRAVLLLYSDIYKNLLVDFIKERMTQ